MKPSERQARIAELIGQEGEVSVEELCHRFDVSGETIRRDLKQLSETGRIFKVHGGARPAKLAIEPRFADRLQQEADGKRCIASKLPGLMEAGDTLFIDTGSTTLACVGDLASIDGITVITNSVGIAEGLAGRSGNCRVYLLGGEFSADAAETVGPMAIAQIGQFQADHAVLTVAALDAEAGAMDASFEEASVARAMIAQSRHTILLATASKFGRRAAYKICDTADIGTLVTDGTAAADAFRQKGVNVL